MEYSSSVYTGDMIEGRFDDSSGTATYKFPDGTCFVGTMVDGAFHGEGALMLSNGQFRGVWEKGKVKSGKYTWDDELEYEEEKWSYCEGGAEGKGDRRFKSERETGVGGAGDVAYKDKGGRNEGYKDGQYAVYGGGYYDVRDDKVKKVVKKEVEGEEVEEEVVLRDVGEEEKQFILAKASTTLSTALGKGDIEMPEEKEGGSENDNDSGSGSDGED